MNQELRKKIVVSNPFDRQHSSDYFADLLREPNRSAKVFKKIVFNERVHLMKIEEFEKRKTKLVNSKFIEKNRLIERLNYYEEKLQALRSHYKKVDINSKQKNLPEPSGFPSNQPVEFLTRAKSMLIEQENKVKFNELMSTESENLVEKKKTFLTSMEDFERETSCISISLLRNSDSKNRQTKKLNVRFQMDDLPTYRSKSCVQTTTVSLFPKLNYDLTATNVDATNTMIGPSRKPSLKERFSIPKHLGEYLPLDIGDYNLPIIASNRT